jgi:drug/metabolite transporter (DMT)-like permease
MLLWLPFVILYHKKVPAGRCIWKDAIMPAVVNTLGQMGWALAAYHNEAGQTAFVIRSSFLFTTLFGVILLPTERRVARHPLFWLGAGGIIAGVVCMSANAMGTGKSSLLGTGILLFTACFWGLYSVFVRRNMHGYDVRLSFGVISLYTTITLWIAMFLFGDVHALGQLKPQVWGLLILSAFLGIAFSHILLYRAIHSLGPLITQGSTAVQPFVTALGAALILHEVLSPMQWFGGTLLVLSCLCMITIRVKIGAAPREKES